jgi:Fic family protein
MDGMDIAQFTAGTWVQQFEYRSFSPTLVNTPWVISDPDLNLLLSEANLKVGELNAFSQLIPNIEYFIKMHVTKEGTQSTRIEGTQTNIDEALQKLAYVKPELKDDWHEVQNYINAMNYAIEQLENLPISSRLLKQAHYHLLQDVRGKHKLPGEYRKSQNWIGGSSLANAVFVPPHCTEIDALMGDLEHFIHDETNPIPHLVKIAIAHYQFETIHPFLDGNGRVGRLLITLYLVEKGILAKPTLYLSDFFEKHRMHYYDKLMAVRTNNDMKQWLRFFLEGVRVTAENSIQTFRRIIELREHAEQQISKLGKRTSHGKQFLQLLYSNPIVDSTDVAAHLKISHSTALRLIEGLVALGILVEKTGFKRNRIFAFEAYIQLFR